MIKISKHILLMLLFYVVDIFACSNLNLPIVNSTLPKLYPIYQEMKNLLIKTRLSHTEYLIMAP
jgi:hypothetical protein